MEAHQRKWDDANCSRVLNLCSDASTVSISPDTARLDRATIRYDAIIPSVDLESLAKELKPVIVCRSSIIQLISLLT